MGSETGLVLTAFRRVATRYETNQDAILDWLAAAHATAERKRCSSSGGAFDFEAYQAATRKLLHRFGCGPDRIAKRGHELDDFVHLEFARMRIFSRESPPEGAATDERLRFHEQATDRVFTELYAHEDAAPRDIIHVTCTGYCSPSSAQKIASRKGWHSQTRVTHVYHMGCFAAFPALRISEGLLAVAENSSGPVRVDIVHTELCSLHLNPSDHSPEQLVVQSLFADGFIAYSAMPVRHFEPTDGRGLQLLGQHEEIIPDSLDDMQWRLSSWGMKMSLAREIPARLAKCINGFLRALLAKAAPIDRRAAIFAIHPGGPRIIDTAQNILELTNAQLAPSRQVLFDNGNMSSATIPAIWQLVIEDDRIPVGTPVVSIAFGPGLTICGAVLRKV